jgi:hypothetical protein
VLIIEAGEVGMNRYCRLVVFATLSAVLCGCETLNIGGGLSPDGGRPSLYGVTISPLGSVTFEADQGARVAVDYTSGVAPLTITLTFSQGVTPATQTITIGEVRPLGPAYWTVPPGTSITEVHFDPSATDQEISVSVSLSDGLFGNAWYSPATASLFVYGN